MCISHSLLIAAHADIRCAAQIEFYFASLWPESNVSSRSVPTPQSGTILAGERDLAMNRHHEKRAYMHLSF